jgi:hypothetical protein
VAVPPPRRCSPFPPREQLLAAAVGAPEVVGLARGPRGVTLAFGAGVGYSGEHPRSTRRAVARWCVRGSCVVPRGWAVGCCRALRWRRYSTRDAPHEQLLVRLGAGGMCWVRVASLVVGSDWVRLGGLAVTWQWKGGPVGCLLGGYCP